MDKFYDFLGITESDTLVFILRSALTVFVSLILIAGVNVVTRRLIKNRAGQKRQNYVYLARYALLGIISVAAVMSLVSGSAKEAINKTLAGSGLVAIVLSIACQEPIGNLCSGLIIMLTHPFRIGDLVRYLDLDIIGYVEEITLRHTVLRTFENRRVIVPNYIMNRSSLENSTYNESKINVPIDINITFDSDLDEAMRIITDVILLHPLFYDSRTTEQIISGSPAVNVLVREFKDSGINLRVWVQAPNSGASFTMKSDILMNVRRRFLESGVRFAYPHIEIVSKEDYNKNTH